MKGRRAVLGALAAAFVAASSAFGQVATDDTLLFSTDNTAPNVLILLDTSGSMQESVYHPDYVPGTSTSSCSWFTGDQAITTTKTSWAPWESAWWWNAGDPPPTGCQARTIPVDPSNTQPVEYDVAYLNWLFDASNDQAASEVANDTVTLACLGETVSRYGRSRITAGKDVLREVICETAASVEVRFALARFRDSQGGYVMVEADDWSDAQDTALTTSINSITADDYTPLSESLFQIYTYFMSRDTTDLKAGEVSGTFPRYDFDLTGADTNSASTADPVLNGCQKHFVIVITDGEPNGDDFETGFGSNAQAGWSSIDDLIGDLDTGDGSLAISNRLNDIAKLMHDTDFRPDLDGDQTLDVYTVGFNTNADNNALLARTALVGGGESYTSNNPEQLTASLVAALGSIIAKAQSFTAATVPASRTTDGASIYLSYFLPQRAKPFWPGHLVKLQFTALGEIKDANDDCALLDANDAVSCMSGRLNPDAVPIWDAADEIPGPGSRNLYVSTSSASSGVVPPTFDTTNASAASLGVTSGDIASYPDSNAADADGLAAELVWYARGCAFGTTGCTTGRSAMLGDIFHSNPLAVGPPNAPVNQSHYRDFARHYEHRTRVLYGGANDGFLHGFLASAWQDVPPTPAFWNDGTGAELFGFMPWQVRQNLKEMPIDTPPRDTYYVDGSPQVTDVRFYGDPQESDASKNWTQWHTVMIGGLRQGGSQYYALDVTNPDKTSEGTAGYPYYPGYLWEFPCEANTATCNAPRPHMGQTWGEPVVARVRVSVDGDGIAHERWVAVLTGGYAASGDPNDFASYSATATAGRAIFIVDIKTGQILAEKKFDPAIVDPSDPEGQMQYAIASTPAVFDLDFDGFADVIMVGDLGGNVWKWVVKDMGGDPINGTDVSDDADQPNWTFKKFFSAPSYTDGTNTWYKSFFYPPTGTLQKGKLILAFASGERENLRADFVASELGDNNRIYVMSDLDPYERSTNATLTEADLENVTDKATCADTATYRGYYVIARDGEKFVTNLSIFLGDLFVGSFIDTDNTNACQADGESFIYRLGLACGDGLFDSSQATSDDPAGHRRMKVGAGMPASPRFSVGPTNDPDPDDPDPPPCRNRVLILTSEGSVTNECPKTLDGAGVKIKTWRQR